jgi:predicted Zn-dependent protease
MSRQIGISVLLSAASSAVDSGIADQAASIGAQLVSLSFSRKQERQADIGGLSYMVAAGYDPKGMVETMQMLESLSETQPVEFFSTHPSPENRIEYIKDDIYMNNYDRPGLKVGADEYRQNVLNRLEE